MTEEFLLSFKKRKFQEQRRKNLFAKPGPHSLIVVIDNLKPSFNVGKIVRSANAFGCKEVHLIGTEFFDPGPAKGAFKHTPVLFFHDFKTCYQRLINDGYTVFAMDPALGTDVHTMILPEKSAFIMGHEEYGLSFNIRDYNEIRFLKIRQFGSVESLNVSIAASIALYEYTRQHGKTR